MRSCLSFSNEDASRMIAGRMERNRAGLRQDTSEPTHSHRSGRSESEKLREHHHHQWNQRRKTLPEQVGNALASKSSRLEQSKLWWNNFSKRNFMPRKQSPEVGARIRIGTRAPIDLERWLDSQIAMRKMPRSRVPGLASGGSSLPGMPNFGSSSIKRGVGRLGERLMVFRRHNSASCKRRPASGKPKVCQPLAGG